MKLKTFEEFDQMPKRYLFYVLDPGINFLAEVRDEDGKVIYTVDKKKMEKGVMSTATDLAALRDYLIKRKKIQQIDEIAPAENTTSPLETLQQEQNA